MFKVFTTATRKLCLLVLCGFCVCFNVILSIFLFAFCWLPSKGCKEGGGGGGSR